MVTKQELARSESHLQPFHLVHDGVFEPKVHVANGQHVTHQGGIKVFCKLRLKSRIFLLEDFNFRLKASDFDHSGIVMHNLVI